MGRPLRSNSVQPLPGSKAAQSMTMNSFSLISHTNKCMDHTVHSPAVAGAPQVICHMQNVAPIAKVQSRTVARPVEVMEPRPVVTNVWVCGECKDPPPPSTRACRPTQPR